jgi:hypothetical protein
MDTLGKVSLPGDVAPRGHAAVKALAQQWGCPLKDVVALSKSRDPFLSGAPAQQIKAAWFLALWQAFAYTTRVHVRRVHYRLVSQPDPRKPDGTPYLNTEQCWELLQEASTAARYLGLVDPLAFEDHRNPSPQLPLDWGQPSAAPSLAWIGDLFGWTLPTIRVDLADDLDFAFPEPEVQGYDYRLHDQPYHLELWIEKSTMNDVLRPLARAAGAVLVTSVGFQSITNAVQLVARRVRESGKPVRIFYLADFDPAGDKMPTAIARQIEFWLPQYAPHADIKLMPLGLTRGQVQYYRLPRIPIKESDTRKAGFEERYGEGAVELDALEALYPGELTTIVRDALAPYIDEDFDERLQDAARDAQDAIAGLWEEQTAPLRERLVAIQTDTQAIYARFTQELEAIKRRLESELAPYAEALEVLRCEVLAAQDAFAPDVPDRPQPQVWPPEESTWLFDSQRTYAEQLRAYKSHSNGVHAEDYEA